MPNIRVKRFGRSEYILAKEKVAAEVHSHVFCIITYRILGVSVTFLVALTVLSLSALHTFSTT